jgi:GntR family carbon starvation induced transcriptional regulator
MMAAHPEPTTRYDWVDGRLQAEIALGNLLPGDRVKVNDLAAAWKVSPTPLREAVQRLAARGVLVMSPQRGARVADVSIEEARQLYDLRLQLEPQALRSSVENRDPAYVEGVEEAYEAFVALRKRPRSNPPTAFELYGLHRAFHDATMARCTSAWLLHLVGVLMDQTMRYVRYSFDRTAPRLDEHKDQVDRIVAGDVDAAVASHEAHLAESAAHMEAVFAPTRAQAQ